MENLLVQQLEFLTSNNQGLINQLRAHDVGTLHGLNAATLATSVDDTEDNITQEQRDMNQYLQGIANAGFTEESLDNDFNSRGWDPAISPSTEGTPVNFTN